MSISIPELTGELRRARAEWSMHSVASLLVTLAHLTLLFVGLTFGWFVLWTAPVFDNVWQALAAFRETDYLPVALWAAAVLTPYTASPRRVRAS